MAAKKKDLGIAEVQEKMDRASEQGFVGTEVDPTPNHAYTVAGVTGSEPTPETDAALKAKADAAAGLTEEKDGDKA